MSYGVIDPITISAIIGGVVSLTSAGINAAGQGAKAKAEQKNLKYELAANLRAQEAAQNIATLQSHSHLLQLQADERALLAKNKQNQFYAVVGIAGIGLVAGLATFYLIRRST
jgi:hypothetical protein